MWECFSKLYINCATSILRMMLWMQEYPYKKTIKRAIYFGSIIRSSLWYYLLFLVNSVSLLFWGMMSQIYLNLPVIKKRVLIGLVKIPKFLRMSQYNKIYSVFRSFYKSCNSERAIQQLVQLELGDRYNWIMICTLKIARFFKTLEHRITMQTYGQI